MDVFKFLKKFPNDVVSFINKLKCECIDRIYTRQWNNRANFSKNLSKKL